MLKRTLPAALLLIHAFFFAAAALLTTRASALLDDGVRLPWMTAASALLGFGLALAPRLNGLRRPALVRGGSMALLLLYLLLLGHAIRSGGTVLYPSRLFDWVAGASLALGSAAPPALAALFGVLSGTILSVALGTGFEKRGAPREPSVGGIAAAAGGLALLWRPEIPDGGWSIAAFGVAGIYLVIFMLWSRATRVVEAALAADATDDPPPQWTRATFAWHWGAPALAGLVLGAIGLLLYRTATLCEPAGGPVPADAIAVCLTALGAGALLTPFLRRIRYPMIAAVLLLAAAGALLAATLEPWSGLLRNLPPSGGEQTMALTVFSPPGPLFALTAFIVGAALQALAPARHRICTARVTLSGAVTGTALGVAVTALALPHLGSLGLDASGEASVSVHEPSGWLEVRQRDRRTAYPLVTIDRRDDLGPTDADEAWARELESHLPLLIHPAPHRVLILGEITGEATRAALHHPDSTVDVVWLTPALREHFGHTVLTEADRRRRPRPVYHRVGPRVLLAGSPATYDVIVDLAGRGRFDQRLGFYTAEYVAAARRALRPDGLYALWISLDRASAPDLVAMVSSLGDEGEPRGDAWCTDPYPSRPSLGLIRRAGRPDAALDPVALAPRLARLGIARLSDPGEVVARSLALAGNLHDVLGLDQAFPITDRNPLVRGPLRPGTAASMGLPSDPRARAARIWLHLQSASPETEIPPEAQTAWGVGWEIRHAAWVKLRAPANEALGKEALDAAYKATGTCLESASGLSFVRSFVSRVAENLLRNRRFDQAAALWRLALEKAPGWGAAHLGQADLIFRNHRNFFRPEDWKPLAAAAERALACDETLARAWIYAGIAELNGAGDLRAARGCFENAAKIDPDSPLLKSYLWRFLDADGRYEEAAALLVDALEAFPDNVRIRDATFKMAPKLRLAGKPRRALYVLQRVEPYYREQSGFYLTMAEVREALGDLEGAVRAARTCCTTAQPPVQGYYIYLYRLLIKAGKDREARETRGHIVDQFGYDPGAVDPDAQR